VRDFLLGGRLRASAQSERVVVAFVGPGVEVVHTRVVGDEVLLGAGDWECSLSQLVERASLEF